MRYDRQIKFDKFGKKGQLLISQATVALVGIGALGSHVLDILARAGVGNIKIIDRDIVELHNLQRQALFDEFDIGKPKALAAYEKIRKINSEIKIEYFIADLDYENLNLLKSDLILDCTDNIYTRFLINDYKKN